MVKEILAPRLTERSSIHGLNELGLTTNKRVKTFWVLILVSGLIIAIQEFSNVISDYINNPRSTRYTHRITYDPFIPDILICPAGFIDPKKVIESGLR